MTIRPLFQVEEEKRALPDEKPEIANRPDEARRVVKRITTIIEEHRQASQPLGFEFGPPELLIVINGLRDHANGGPGSLELTDHDEIESHCLKRLFEELVEEPSNILYVTQTGPESTRYDAMDSSFWLECLDLLEKNNSN
ncbi:MAG: hypothetical protein AAGC74_01480 [Verrucomicrobiota bacterium]